MENIIPRLMLSIGKNYYRRIRTELSKDAIIHTIISNNFSILFDNKHDAGEASIFTKKTPLTTRWNIP